jgi:glycine oxidase
MSRSADAVVIGGGVIGLAVAYYLAREKLAVTLVERGRVGREASWAAAGYLSFQGSSNRPGPRLELTRTSARMYEEWIRGLGELTAAETGFWRSGLLELYVEDAEVREARERAAWQRTAGYAVEWLDETSVRKRQPALAPELPVRGALLFPEVAQVRPPRLLKALEDAVRRLGVDIREYSAAAGLARSGDRVAGVGLASGESVSAPIVVNAAGSWASQLAPEMAVMPIRPIKGTIVLLEVATQPSREILVSAAGSLYPRADNTLLLGATMEDVGYDRRVKLEAVRTLVQQALELMPGLRDANLVTAWTGLRPYSHDNVPYLGAVPDLEGAFVAAGHYRSGILLAPITGLLLKEVILRQASTLPMEPYQMSRALLQPAAS